MNELPPGHQESAPSCALHADLLGRHAVPAVPEAALHLQSLKSPWGALGPALVVPNTSQHTPMQKLVCRQMSQLLGSFPPAASSGSSAGVVLSIALVAQQDVLAVFIFPTHAAALPGGKRPAESHQKLTKFIDGWKFQLLNTNPSNQITRQTPPQESLAPLTLGVPVIDAKRE
ncbi:MAG: hypothetical protein FRX49_07982 [Trebouxia sp. A1-2]|nr:MAG: hypothetical protein FRX49_07982 [Trebouxia sp. A1-2]